MAIGFARETSYYLLPRSGSVSFSSQRGCTRELPERYDRIYSRQLGTLKVAVYLVRFQSKTVCGGFLYWFLYRKSQGVCLFLNFYKAKHNVLGPAWRSASRETHLIIYSIEAALYHSRANAAAQGSYRNDMLELLLATRSP